MIRKTAIIGMGALGLLYGDQIARALGPEAVAFVMDPERRERYRGKRFTCNGEEKRFRMVSWKEAEPADLVMVAVKSGGLTEALDTMASSVGPDTVILSVMNGISSEEILARRYGWNRVLYCVAQGMDAMRDGSRLRYTQVGQLCIGAAREEQRPALARTAEFFRSIRLPFTEEADILHRLWGKLMLNVGINQTCMAYGTTYSGALAPGTEANRTLLAAMREVIALANAEGVDLTEKDLDEYIGILRTLSPDGIPSMAQDAAARRPSEVELFAGTVIPMAERHGLPVPANRFLYRRIREMEAGYPEAAEREGACPFSKR